MTAVRGRAVVARESSPELGRRLRELRQSRGMTQSEVAGAELTKALVSQIELGRTRPSEQTLALIANRLGTSSDVLLAALPERRADDIDPRVVMRQSEALIAVNRTAEAERLLRACDAAPLTPQLAATAMRLHAEVALRRGDTTNAAAAATAAMMAAEKAGAGLETVLAANVAGRAHFATGRFPAALQYFDAAVTAAEGLEDVDARLHARLHANRGNAHWRLGDREPAHADFEAALRWSESAEDLRQLGIAHMGLGESARENGDLVAAAQHIERAIALFERVEERLLLVQNLHNLGEATAARGDRRTARRLHERSLAAARAMTDRRTAGYALERIAALDVEEGDVDAAVAGAREAVSCGRATGDNHLLSLALATLGDALERQGHPRTADRAFGEAVEVARKDGSYSLRRALLRRGEHERRRGRLDAAAAAFESAALVAGAGARRGG